MNQHPVKKDLNQTSAAEQLFRYKDFAIEYIQFGEGEETLICFHGFGRTCFDFGIFAPLLRAGQRIVSINLFAHGGSRFPESRIEKSPLTPQEWQNMFGALLGELGISQFHLIGYSMGGRIVLKTMELFEDRILSVLLLAPDGFKINKIYKFASGTALGKAIYRSMIKNPNLLFATAKRLNQLGVLDGKLNRFVHVHLDTREKRVQVYEAWMIYKLFFSDQDKLAHIIRSRNMKFNMIFGKYDSIIRPFLGESFSKKLNSEKPLHIIDTGHRLLDGNTVNYIRQRGLWG